MEILFFYWVWPTALLAVVLRARRVSFLWLGLGMVSWVGLLGGLVMMPRRNPAPWPRRTYAVLSLVGLLGLGVMMGFGAGTASARVVASPRHPLTRSPVPSRRATPPPHTVPARRPNGPSAKRRVSYAWKWNTPLTHREDGVTLTLERVSWTQGVELVWLQAQNATGSPLSWEDYNATLVQGTAQLPRVSPGNLPFQAQDTFPEPMATHSIAQEQIGFASAHPARGPLIFTLGLFSQTIVKNYPNFVFHLHRTREVKN